MFGRGGEAMTLDELVKLAQAQPDARAVTRVIVEALRPRLELYLYTVHQDVTEKSAAAFADGFINEILASDGVEAVKDSGGVFGGLMDGLAKACAPAAAPVCEWLDDGNPRKRRRNSCGLQGANMSWAGMNWICTGCLKPIKFVEAAR